MVKKDEITMYLDMKKFGLTPNEYFYLILLHKGAISMANFDVEAVKESLKVKGYDDPGSLIKSIVKEPLEGLDDFVEQYRSLFPKGLLPSGKQARSSLLEVKGKMKWFLMNFDFTKEQILDATTRYVEEYRLRDFLYMQTASYFIYKEDNSKIRHSSLAERCEGSDEPIESSNFGIDA